ncbi:hypothetical protein [Thauera sinica]|uniref:Uncharacterized protein n=1 Tax=Thauera sinica TaxID=2665146 RepID=A0ABW1ARH6_9RHOO|nr:hypothetical protein [Thauera sp. K11]ATE59696.1 hypothetical protein CCZ27_06800 [Thauera sp. K11]
MVTLLCIAIPQEGRAEDTSTSSVDRLVSGNTLAVSNRFGPTLIHFYEGGRFRHIGLPGQTAEGVWRAADDSICVTVTSLPPGRVPQEFCLELKGRSFGSKWTAEDPRNGTIVYELLKGHPEFGKAM